MKIDLLTLRNFRSHAETKLELSRLSFILGHNRSGKSSIQMALEMLFTGHCQATDQAGRGAEALVRQGEAQGFVSARLADGSMFARRYSANGQGGQTLEINRQPIPVRIGERTILEKVGCGNTAAVGALLDAGRFLALSAAEQKILLSQALAGGAVNLSNDDVSAWTRLFPTVPLGAPDAASIAKHYQAVYERRRALRRELDTLPPPDDLGKSSQPPDEAGIKQRLADLRAARERLFAERATQESSWRAAQDRLATLEAQKVKLQAEMLSPDDLAGLEASLSAKPKRSEIEQRIAQVAVTMSAQEQTLNGLGRMGAKCPVVPSLDCPAEAHKLVQIGKAASIEHLAAKQELARLEKELAALPDSSVAEARIARNAEVFNRARQIAAEMIEARHSPKPDTEKIHAQILALDERIIKGEGVVAEVSARAQAVASAARLTAKKELLYTLLKDAERLLQSFGPDGIGKCALADKIPAFIQALNGALNRFGYQADFSLDPYRITVSDRDVDSLEPHCLSESERYRFGIALQIALAEATGISFVVIDRADLLDKISIRDLTETLLASKLEQAIILATRTDKPLLRILSPEYLVKFFWLERRDGQSCAEEIPNLP